VDLRRGNRQSARKIRQYHPEGIRRDVADDQSGLFGQRGGKERGVAHPNNSMNGKGDEVEEQCGFLLYRGGEFA
jgi:hypothetical protein